MRYQFTAFYQLHWSAKIYNHFHGLRNTFIKMYKTIRLVNTNFIYLCMAFSKRQIEIIEVSMQLIASKGIQNLTTKNIAEEMGFTEPSIYRHFQNKTAILEGIIKHYQDEMKMQSQIVLASKKSPMEKLFDLVKIQFAHFSKNRSISVIIFSELIFQHDEKLALTVSNVIKKKLQLTVSMIKKGQQEGCIRTDVDASGLATMYIGSIRFTLLQWKLNGFTLDLNLEAKKLNNNLARLLK